MTINFGLERQRHAGFVGRRALLSTLDRLLVEDRVDRWVVVTGGPGMGKSALLAAWLARREAVGEIVPHHFIRRGWADWDDADALVDSLIAQIGARFPESRDADAADGRLPAAARLAASLLRVSQRALQPRAERLALLIDGLDEYDARPGACTGDPLAAFLPFAMPVGVSVLCASRRRASYVEQLEPRGTVVQLDLDGEPGLVEDNAATVRAFWQSAAVALELSDALIAQAVASAAGNLQHAVMLRRQLESVPSTQRRIDDAPRGLVALLSRAWDRISNEPIVVTALGLLCVAREPLTLDELGQVAGWAEPSQRRAFLHGARELLIEARRGDGGIGYRLHHDSIRAYIVDALGGAVLANHHLAFARTLAAWPRAPGHGTYGYALRHALQHRAEAGAWVDAWRVAGDLSFLEARYHELGVRDTEADVERLALRCRGHCERSLERRFADLARALRRESYWLGIAPEAIAGLVWNRLRRAGWSEAEVAAQLRLPPDAEFLRVRHAAIPESAALIRNLAGHTLDVVSCAITPDGRRAVSIALDDTLRIWDLDTAQVLATFKHWHGVGAACAITPDGAYVISASTDHELRGWDWASGGTTVLLRGHTGAVNDVVVTSDGRHVVSASSDKTVRIWDLVTGLEIARLEGHDAGVTACAVSSDGAYVVSASRDGTLRVWRRTGQRLHILRGHAEAVLACAVSADGYVVSASRDRTLGVWSLADGRRLATCEGHRAEVTACAITQDGRIISGSSDKTIRVWNLASARPLAVLEGHVGDIVACSVTLDGRVVSASHDATLKIWDPANDAYARTPSRHFDAVYSCAMTPDGLRLLTVSEDRTMKAWEVDTGRVLVSSEMGDAVTCQVSPDARYLLCEAGAVLVVEVTTQRVIASLPARPASVDAWSVSRDGRYLIVGSIDKALRVWDLTTSTVVANLEGPYIAVSKCLVTPDGRHAVACAGSLIWVWDLATSCLVSTFGGYGTVTAIVMTPDGRHVISSWEDSTLRVWGLCGGEPIAVLRGHADWVCACAVTPDGRYAISTSEDRTLRVWDLSTYACRLIHRGDTTFHVVAAGDKVVCASDKAGIIWFLDMPPRESPVTSVAVRPSIDIGILTIREDEFRAVLSAFPDKLGIVKGPHREYAVRRADAGGGAHYRVAVLRQSESGQGEAQDAARDMIQDLAPRLVLVVGIAGGRPSADVKLGDVVVSTRIHDFTVEARQAGAPDTYAATGGPIDRALAGLVANLAARDDELGSWTSELPPQPTVSWTKPGEIYGARSWRSQVRAALEYHYAPGPDPRVPIYIAGPIASSDRLIKDPRVLIPWLQTVRNLLATEMESGGVYRAARERCPMLTIRGISDIVGLKRSEAWTKYACTSAAAFTKAFLRTQPVVPGTTAAAVTARACRAGETGA